MHLLSMLNWAQPAKPNVNTIMSHYHPIYLPHVLHFTPHLASHTHTHFPSPFMCVLAFSARTFFFLQSEAKNKCHHILSHSTAETMTGGGHLGFQSQIKKEGGVKKKNEGFGHNDFLEI